MEKIITAIISFFKSFFGKGNVTIGNKKIKVNCNHNNGTTINTHININNGSDSSDK